MKTEMQRRLVTRTVVVAGTSFQVGGNVCRQRYDTTTLVGAMPWRLDPAWPGVSIWPPPSDPVAVSAVVSAFLESVNSEPL